MVGGLQQQKQDVLAQTLLVTTGTLGIVLLGSAHVVVKYTTY